MRLARRRSLVGGHLGSGVLAVASALTAVAALALVMAGGSLPRWVAPVTLAAAAIGLGAGAWLQRRAEREERRVRRAVADGLAHAVRTPLAQVHMQAEMLLAGRTPSPEEQERALMNIDGAARRLSRAVENAVAFASLSNPGLLLVPTTVDLGALIEDAAADAAGAFRARGIVLDADPPSGLLIDADRQALRLALDNLLDNALQHGAAGQHVLLAVGVDRGGRAVISITDEGDGVSKRDRLRIWHPFARLSAPGQPERNGGLGLAIVRAVAEGHGGDAWVEAAPRGGARFCISLPASTIPATSLPLAAAL
jgi:signal transduction histidine kinase